ncbi:hypothetical protein [Lactobacillus sp. Sy-1]|uniref:hypothetical protein n=1 Tax=Lactobacillus sp. Sy-1 TaxID=2109645 RepID=UPI001C5A7848|nr:hypothetical protein [Lactobacillus sp. Sy-1]MBW1606079.1 hypothetical protein [Lactobacillus sp. Sy-1]
MEKLYAAQLQRNIFTMDGSFDDKLSLLRALTLISKNAEETPNAMVLYSDISDDYEVTNNHLDSNKIWNRILDQINVMPGFRTNRDISVAATSVFIYRQRISTYKEFNRTLNAMAECPAYGYDQRIDDYERYDTNPEIKKLDNALNAIKAILYGQNSNILYDKQQIVNLDFDNKPDPLTYQELIKRLNKSFS